MRPVAGRRALALSILMVATAWAGCGKKGPPLPPIVRLPAPPAEFTVLRRGPTVAIQFVVPGSNTDGSGPADLSRIEIYALTGLSTITPDDIVRRGTRLGSIAVHQPEEPDETEEENTRREALRAPDAVEQGATVRLSETLAFDVSADPSDVRSYVAVGFNRRNRRGAFSTRVLVPLTPAPPAPPAPAFAWDDKAITVGWGAPDPVPDNVAYNVYAPGEVEVRLTPQPIAEARLVDSRLAWDVERCYVVRTVTIVETLSLESDASPPTCATVVDIFEPAAPQGLNTVPSEGAVNLIWNANNEPDLAGYLVLRAIAPEERLTPVTPSPIAETTFRDTVPTGSQVSYAIQAVDKAGNRSPLSERVLETAR